MDKIKASTLADLAYYSRFKPPSRLVTFAAPASTLTNFPALVKSNSTFHIGTSTGYDVHFQDLAGNELAYDLDYYDPVTGNGAWWVQIPSLPSSGPTSIKMLYGDSSVTTNGSTPSTVWADYTYVYHFNDVNDLSPVVGNYTPTDISTSGTTASTSLVSNSLTGRGVKFRCLAGYGDAYYSLRIGNAFEVHSATMSIFGTTDVPGHSSRFIRMETGWTNYKWVITGGNWTTGAGSLSASTALPEPNGIYCYGGGCNASEVSWVTNGTIRDTTGATANKMRWDLPNFRMNGAAAYPTEIVWDEIRISTTTYKPAAWLQYEQNQMINHSTYTTYGPET